MGEMLLLCCIIIFVSVIYFVYYKDKQKNHSHGDKEDYRKQIEDKYLTWKKDRDYYYYGSKNSNRHITAAKAEFKPQKLAYDHFINHSGYKNKEDLYINNRYEEEESKRRYKCQIEQEKMILDSRMNSIKKEDEKKIERWNENWNWLFNDNSSCQNTIRVIKADEYMKNQGIILNNNKVVLDTSAYKTLFHTQRKKAHGDEFNEF